MSNTTRTLPKVWRWEDGYGAEAPRDADKRQIIADWLWMAEGLEIDVLDGDAIARLESEMYFLVLHSVVKADVDFIDTDDCGGFHSEASGKRTKPAWFIDAHVLLAAIDAAEPRPISGDSELGGES